MEKQFRRFLDIAKKSKGNTANTMMQLLETRLDNVLRRLGVGRTIWATRQIVAHGHVMVNGRKTDIASYLVKPGQTITFKEGIHKMLPREHGTERRAQGAELAGMEPGPADRDDQGDARCRRTCRLK